MMNASSMWPPQHQERSALIVSSCMQWLLRAQAAGAMPPGLRLLCRARHCPTQLVLFWQLEGLQVSSLSRRCSAWQRMGHASAPAML